MCLNGILFISGEKLLENYNIKVSRLSYGIPLGGDMEYLDPLTIARAMEGRNMIS